MIFSERSNWRCCCCCYSRYWNIHKMKINFTQTHFINFQRGNLRTIHTVRVRCIPIFNARSTTLILFYYFSVFDAPATNALLHTMYYSEYVYDIQTLKWGTIWMRATHSNLRILNIFKHFMFVRATRYSIISSRSGICGLLLVAHAVNV